MNIGSRPLRGICFGQNAYYCIECKVDFCGPCQQSHAITHASSIVRGKNHSWPPHKEIAAQLGTCSLCSIEVKCRIECGDCSLAICTECAEIQDRVLGFYKHREQKPCVKGFISLISPLKNVVPPVDHECECLRVRGCISHCGRCFKGELVFNRCSDRNLQQCVPFVIDSRCSCRLAWPCHDSHTDIAEVVRAH